jgi:hypothetical protein
VDFPRFWRRNVKPLGTLGGNPSALDDVLAAGPPTTDLSGPPNLGYFAEEQAAAVHGDLLRDISSAFDSEADAESRMWGSFGKKSDEST